MTAPSPTGRGRDPSCEASAKRDGRVRGYGAGRLLTAVPKPSSVGYADTFSLREKGS